MGLIYAFTSLIAIVRKHGENGLTLDEILGINKKSYRAKIKEYIDFIKENMWTKQYLEVRDGKYFRKDSDLDGTTKHLIQESDQRLKEIGNLP